MARSFALAVVLAAAFAVFFLAARTPRPPPAPAAPTGEFCAGCALADIAVIGRAPHPIGTAADAAVRNYLFTRMTQLGLSPRVQQADSQAVRRLGGDTMVALGTVRNLIGVIPGRDRSAPALALMAHYDSVPGSPGAADDSTGVADVLDVTRAIRARGEPARDVLIVLTDGEEAGLLGARAFFDQDSAAGRIGYVINLETRGGGGRAHMFETGADDGADIDLFRRTETSPDSNAIFPFVYRYLPNDTDFTVARARHIPGFNFAFIGRQFDYHSPTSTVAALDRGSVQHLGESVLAPAVAIAFGEHLPPRRPDAVYSDVLGRFVIAYAPVFGWVLLIASAVLVVAAPLQARRRERLSFAGAGLGATAGIACLLVAAAVLWFARRTTGAGASWMIYRPLLARFPVFETAMALSALGAALLCAALCGRWDRRASGWTGLLITGLAAGVALQLTLPLIAFAVQWPLLAAAAGAALTAGGVRRSPPAWALYGAVAVIALAWVGTLLHGYLEGLDAAPGCALFAWLALMILWPLALGPQGRGWARLAPAALAIGAGLACCLWLRVTDPWSARHPRAVEPLLLVQSDGRAQVASLAPADDWTRRLFGSKRWRPAPKVPGAPGPLVAAPWRPQPAPADAPVTVQRRPGGELVFTAPSQAPGDSLVLDVRTDGPMRSVVIDGVPVAALAKAGARLRVVGAPPSSGMRLVVEPIAHGALEATYALWSPGWPADGPPLPPLPADRMLWDRSGSTVRLGAQRVPF
jgi:hypothetical protein